MLVDHVLSCFERARVAHTVKPYAGVFLTFLTAMRTKLQRAFSILVLVFVKLGLTVFRGLEPLMVMFL